MKITDIYESTTSGSVATVSSPLGKTQSRNASIYGDKKGGDLLTGKKTNKKYANSVTEAKADRERNRLMQIATDYEERAKKTKDPIKKDHYRKMADDARSKIVEKGHVSESKMKELASDIRDMDNGNFQKKYKKSKEQMKYALGDPDSKKTVHEAHLEEDDLILVPGQGHRLKTGFHAFDPDKAEHEGETLKNSLRTIARNAKELHSRLENHDQFPEWVSEKIGQIKGMITSVTEYLISHQEGDAAPEHEGVIAGGGVGEGVGEKIKGVIRREKSKDMPLVQTRRDYAMGKAGDAYNKGEIRKGNQYSAYAERDRKKKNDPTTNPAGTYRTKTSDYTNEAQSMGTALKNTLAKAEPGSKLDNSIKSHNRHIKAGLPGTLKNAPTGYHFDSKGYCRLGDK